MRIFTDNDKNALARALQSFMGWMNGQQVKINVHLAQTRRLLDAGIKVDEFLNYGNYARALEIEGNVSVERYADMLINGEIEIRSLKEEEDWEDSEMLYNISQIFHDFYIEICYKGGEYSTIAAKNNLRKAVIRNSLQAVMSEKLILEIMEKTSSANNLTCFNYLKEILYNQEDYSVDNSLSAEQMARMQGGDKSYGTGPDIQPEETTITEDSMKATEQSMQEQVPLNTEPAPQPDDESIFGHFDRPDNGHEQQENDTGEDADKTDEADEPEGYEEENAERCTQECEAEDDDDIEPEPDEDFLNGEAEPEPEPENIVTDREDGEAYDDGTDGFDEPDDSLSTKSYLNVPSPKDFKRARTLDALKSLSLQEMKELTGLFPPDIIFEDFITMLSAGEFDKTKETVPQRQVHQIICSYLYSHFIDCAAMQGISISEETVNHMDILMANWDLRDAKTRKLQKIKDLIYNAAAETAVDKDLMDVIEDLEELYEKE